MLLFRLETDAWSIAASLGDTPIATRIAAESRILMALLLIAGAAIFLLAALVVPPEGEHAIAQAAETTSAETNEHAADVATSVTDKHEPAESATGDHADVPPAAGSPVEATGDHDGAAGSTESHDGEAVGGHAEAEEHVTPPELFLGVDISGARLVHPRAAFFLIVASLVISALTLWRRSTILYAAVVAIGFAALVLGVMESLRAGEELGIFVPLPVLASILYGGAALLAIIAIVELRSPSLDQHGQH